MPKDTKFSGRLGLFCLTLVFFALLAAGNSIGDVADDGLVHVNFYGESYCPYCREYWQGPIRAMMEHVSDIVAFRYIPYGNARTLSNGTVLCQHGATECKLNAIEACVLDQYPKTEDNWIFMLCVESAASPIEAVRQCSDTSSMDYASTMICAAGDLGAELIRRYADETHHLQPPHEFVPWITINGKPQGDPPEADVLIATICASYSGNKAKPTSCTRNASESSLASIKIA